MQNETVKDFSLKRMLSEKEARIYTGLGRNSVRNLAEKIGAIHHYGRRILYDRWIIDEYFNSDKTRGELDAAKAAGVKEEKNGTI